MHDLSFLSSVVVILFAAVLVVAIFRRFHLSPVLGYFVAGAAIGEHGWFKIVESEDISVFGELGVVFLLFAIGLELTFERLKSMRAHVFGLGGAQVVLTSVVMGLIVYFFHRSINPAMVIGWGFALSSTAIVLQVVNEQRKQSTQVGRLSLAVLLMQDFAVVPLLVMVPLLSPGEGATSHALDAIGSAMLKAVFALILIFILGRLFLRPIFRAIHTHQSKNNELFIATTLLIVLGSAWATEKMGLSLALGAFVAGLLVAETEYQLHAEESINPFKGLLLGLFFMAVGMSFNMDLLIQKLYLILSLSFGLIAIKASIVFGLCMLFKFRLGIAIHAGLLLAQGSEFAFILFNLATQKGVISSETGQILMIVVTITMALTPLLSMIGNIISDFLEQKEKMGYEEMNKEVADLYNHVIIIGFGRVGKMVARLLAAEKVNYISLDIDGNHVVQERKEGMPVYLGNGENIDVLESIGLLRAKSIIVTVEDEKILKKIMKSVREVMPKIPIIIRSKDLYNDQKLYRIGATTIVPETYETGLQMGGAVLKSVGIAESEISRIKNQFRLGNYVMAQEDDKIDESRLND